ncbi:hypothetical protein [Tenuifilum thalassicum]|uniref:Right-handed parallel beta-helix repeat-containing protein n=1 Tax=Tenuifilum thalassicum TaxID=2590900 RepID=A0A7D4BQR0_9BACT|nr:hypothetical protein [Tenuifilum thalassicum]QKG79021.1 hypothetical protein FHG85_01655 [Tenuifilum thalassicum]
MLKQLLNGAFFATLSVLLLFSCEQERFTSDPSIKLSFSSDTILFDTVFTTIGSSTRYLKVYNKSKRDIKISEIKLAGGESSPYRINVDGRPGPVVNDIPLRSNDSLFVFVEVTIDPNQTDAPLLIPDSIIFTTNSNIQDVKLVAWGQDVYLYNSTTVTTDSVLQPNKPHLIYNYLYVKPNVTLTIPAGTRLSFHNNAQLVVSGTLKVLGTFDNQVTMQGDRLEDFYADKGGQWSGVWLAAGSKENVIEWADIKNAVIGLIVDTCVTPGTPTLTLSHSKIGNASYVAFLGRGAKVEADNCLFYNSAYSCVALTLGGEYRFYHSTIANYWGDYIFRKGPALLLNNYYTYQQSEESPTQVIPRDLTEASFFNSIIYGSISNEIGLDYMYNGQPVSAEFNYSFTDCILKVPTDFNLDNPLHFTRTTRDNPKFKNIEDWCFELDTLSPAKDIGNIDIANRFPIDLNGENRLNDGKPDIGAFERIE